MSWGLGASLTPCATLQRASIRTPVPRDDAKADDAVVRTQEDRPHGYSLQPEHERRQRARPGWVCLRGTPSLAQAVAVGDPRT